MLNCWCNSTAKQMKRGLGTRWKFCAHLMLHLCLQMYICLCVLVFTSEVLFIFSVQQRISYLEASWIKYGFRCLLARCHDGWIWESVILKWYHTEEMKERIWESVILKWYHTEEMKEQGNGGPVQKQKQAVIQSIPFSAFWLRSSVVSVLISLISDTWPNGPHDIKLISLGGEPITGACFWGSRSSPMRCITARAWRTPTKP
jgi:hypothetical protein